MNVRRRAKRTSLDAIVDFTIELGQFPVEGGVALAYRAEIEAAERPEERRRELEDEMLAFTGGKGASPNRLDALVHGVTHLLLKANPPRISIV